MRFNFLFDLNIGHFEMRCKMNNNFVENMLQCTHTTVYTLTHRMSFAFLRINDPMMEKHEWDMSFLFMDDNFVLFLCRDSTQEPSVYREKNVQEIRRVMSTC